MAKTMIKLDDYKPYLPGGVPRPRTKFIIVHCADTKANMDVGVKQINQWHRERKWSGVGYHYVIRRGGELEAGRDLKAMGAHAKGYNFNSIGICLVGGRGDNGQAQDNFDHRQYATLESLILSLIDRYPGVKIIGHRDVEKGKLCPCFDVATWCNERGLIGV